MRSRHRLFLVGVFAAAAAIACAPILGLDDLHERSPGGGADAGSETAPTSPAEGGADDANPPARDAGPDGDAAVDAGDPCEFTPVTDVTVTSNEDYAYFRIPNLAGQGPNTSSFEDRGDTVLDKVTGLVWEKAPAAESTFAAGALRCAQTPGGWRIPTRAELVTLMYFGNLVGGAPPAPCADGPFTYPATPSRFYFTATRGAGYQRDWYLDFNACGAVPFSNPNLNGSIRCVSGAKKPPAFAISEKCGIVRDLNTRLEWQRGLATLQPPLNDDANNNAVRNHCTTLHLREPLKGSGWAVPSQKELYSIVDSTRVAPAISLVLFPDTPGSDTIISSTLNAPNNYAGISLETGEADGRGFGNAAYVKCVRHMP